jgi:hypothetical protein
MDEGAFKNMVLPVVIQLLAALGKYIVPAICAVIGMEEAKVSNWWTASAAVLGGLIVGAASNWLHRKHIITAADKAAAEESQP